MLGTGLSVASVRPTVAIVIAVVVAVVTWALLARRLPRLPDDVARRWPLLALLWALLATISVWRTVRLADYMADASHVESAVVPRSDFWNRHSCLAAYYEAARLERAGETDIYDLRHYLSEDGTLRHIGPFEADAFLYPPALLLPFTAGIVVSEDFAAWRVAWFGIEGLIVLTSLVVLAAWLGVQGGAVVLAFTPMLIGNTPTLLTLQIGNYHLIAVAVSVVAMVAFERDRPALGGALLSWAVLTKLFPGILLLLLIVQRRWRSVAWVCGFMALITCGSLAVSGPAPTYAFLSQLLPSLARGSAQAHVLIDPNTAYVNDAAFGFAQKLAVLLSTDAALDRPWIITLLLVPLLAILTVKNRSRELPSHGRAAVWLALLFMASLLTPFLPEVYSRFPLQWVLVLLLAGSISSRTRMAAVVCGLAIAAVHNPTGPVDGASFRALAALGLQVSAAGLAVWVAWSGGRGRHRRSSAPA